jgi:ABC-type polysaccharide/polyol phosphate transport system ATPase subunit
MSMTVQVSAVGKSFPVTRRHRVDAVRQVSFEVGRGECVGIIGRNGSGKTTLLRMLAGVLQPDSGEIRVDGGIAALIEASGGIEQDASGIENLRNLLVLQGVGVSQLPRTLDRAITFAQLGEFIAHPVRTYSSGMLMRLAFAAVIFLDADILLVDEVLSVGDPVFQRRCANEIRRFVGDGGTMILSSHNYHEVAALCERVILMHDGEIVIDGAADDVFRTFWQQNEQDLMRISPHGETLLLQNPLKAHTPLARNTGEVRIEGVRFITGDGIAADQVAMGQTQAFDRVASLQPLTIEIAIVATTPVQSPMCRVQFHRGDGLFLMGSNTHRHGLDLGRVEGTRIIRLSYDSFPLAEGEYYVSVGLWPDEYCSFIAEQALDYHEHTYILRVTQQRRDGGGLVASNHHWTFV